MRKIVYTFKVNKNRYGVSLYINDISPKGVIIVSVYTEDNYSKWKYLSTIYGHKINNGEKIIYVGATESSEYFNIFSSELIAAEIHVISWLESLEYPQILEYSSMLETEE